MILLVLAGFAIAHAGTGYLRNSSDLRPVLLRYILPYLRIYIDVKPDEMPFYRDLNEGFQQISLQEIKDAVKLGIGNWKSVLPDMHFRIVDSEAEVNLVLRFRNYGRHISRGASAEAFSPGAWQQHPDFSCGKTADGEDNFDPEVWGNSYFPDGRKCNERRNNIILFQLWGGAFYNKHFASSLERYQWDAARLNRSRPWFRPQSDPLFNDEDQSTCAPGHDENGAPWGVFDPICLDPADWQDLPHAGKFGINDSYADLAYLVQHEFGHTIMGDHTGAIYMGGSYKVNTREPVVDIDYAIRKARLAEIVSLPGITAPTSYSIMFPGNGIESTWNIRGVFDVDADRLASGTSDTSTWQGYPAAGWRMTYPVTDMAIELQNSETGEIFETRDWHKVLVAEGSLEAAGLGASGNHAVVDTTTAHLYRPLGQPAGGDPDSEVWLSFMMGDDDNGASNALALIEGGSAADGGSRLYDRRLFSIEITGQGDQRAWRIKKHWANDQWISPGWDNYGAGSVAWTPGDHLVLVRISMGEDQSDAAAWIDPPDLAEPGAPDLTLEGNGNRAVTFDGILWYVEPSHAAHSARLDEIRIGDSLQSVIP